ncbi:MAG: MFS transporter [Pseudomonadales bacterium]|nr:MFS transporter [Pseudomonadales bacterium]
MNAITRNKYDVWVIAASLFTITLSVNLQIPLYTRYATEGGFGDGFIALIFSVYVMGLIPVLIIFGGISDRIGRKRSIVTALLISLLSNVLVSMNGSLEVLFLVRLLQGISVAIVLGASAAFLSDCISDLNRAANLHGIVVSLGLGSGAIITSFSLSLLKWETPASYFMVTGANLLCLVLAIFIKKGDVGRIGKMIRFPIVTNESWKFCCSIFFTWSLVGVVITVVPSILLVMGFHGGTGLVVFLAVSSGAFFQPLCRKRSSEWALETGLYIAGISYVLLLLGVYLSSVPIILLSAGLTGMSGLGFVYVGGLRSVMDTKSELRSRAVSGYFIFGYLGLGLPCVGIGYLGDTVGILEAIFLYGVVSGTLVVCGYIYGIREKGRRIKIRV